MRQIVDERGRTWEAVPVPHVVAHLRKGAVLGFRPGGGEGEEPIRTPVEFNSTAAAEFAIRTMGEKELRRRLDWAKAEAGLQ